MPLISLLPGNTQPWAENAPPNAEPKLLSLENDSKTTSRLHGNFPSRSYLPRMQSVLAKVPPRNCNLPTARQTSFWTCPPPQCKACWVGVFFHILRPMKAYLVHGTRQTGENPQASAAKTDGGHRNHIQATIQMRAYMKTAKERRIFIPRGCSETAAASNAQNGFQYTGG